MGEIGYIYILFNPSIPGLVKIGKTERDPRERARELSQATGVATPFEVAYTAAFADCDVAERYMHAVLEHNGFRLAGNREFFEVPLPRAIDFLLDAKRRFGSPETISQTREISDSKSSNVNFDDSDRHLAYETYVTAMAAWFGLGDTIQDCAESLRLLKKAVALDFPAAYTALAEYYSQRLVPPDFSVAMNYLKQGAARGHARCFVAMADLFRQQGNIENFSKCWKKYFSSQTFLEDDDRKWTEKLATHPTWADALGAHAGWPRINYIQNYLDQIARLGIQPTSEVREVLLPFRDELLRDLDNSLTYWTAQPRDDRATFMLRHDHELLDFAKRILR